jgi:hypothetical protein
MLHGNQAVTSKSGKNQRILGEFTNDHMLNAKDLAIAIPEGGRDGGYIGRNGCSAHVHFGI